MKSKLISLLPKFKGISRLFQVQDTVEKSQGRKWSLDGLLLVKKWRAFLNSTTEGISPISFQNRSTSNLPFGNEEIILVTENRFGGSSRLVKLICGSETKLKTRSGKINSLDHNLAIGKYDGCLLEVKNVPYHLQRASLSDYIVHMKRVATPCYPKDIQAMLSMGDVKQGSVVLEAGTGSGALTLYLSSAVGQEGQVHSFDNNEKHLKRAKENVSNWINSWNKANRTAWPNNVTFYNTSLRTFRENLPASIQLDTILLDLQSPENYLELLIPSLKRECPIVIFLPSITQVVDVVSHCDKNNLPFLVDKVVEVIHRYWKIQSVKPVDKDLEDKMDNETDVDVQSGTIDSELEQVKYAAKPSFQQLPHTGFILKLVHQKYQQRKTPS